jgi:glycosyltransferase involved in cell wall biosynthesis
MYKRKDTAEDISIVMAVYNHEATVAQALESALAQVMPYKSMIYCINDASTDSSAEILEKYASKYPDKIRVFTSPSNLGSGKKAFLFHKPPVKGKYWCLLAGDDFWTDESKLFKQITFLNENKDFVGCGCDTVVKDEVRGVESFIRPCKNIFNIFDLILLKHKYAFYVHTTSLVWRNINKNKDTFLPPAFKKDFAKGDVILAHMMLGGGGKLYNIPEVMSCYRITGLGVWSSLSSGQQEEMNNKLECNLKRATPMMIKVFIHFQFLRDKYKLFQRLIPGAINE